MKLSELPVFIRDLVKDKISIPTFIGELPSLADQGIAIKAQEGYTNSKYFGQYPNLYEPLFIVSIRTNTYSVGANTAQTLIDTLDKFTDNDGIKSINLVGSIVYLGRSQQKLHEFQVTFTTIFKEE